MMKILIAAVLFLAVAAAATTGRSGAGSSGISPWV